MLSHSIANLGFISLIVHVLLITTSVEANPPKKEESETIAKVEANPTKKEESETIAKVEANPTKKELKTVTIKAYCKEEEILDETTNLRIKEMVPVYDYIKRRIYRCVENGYTTEEPKLIEGDNSYYAFIFKQDPQKKKHGGCENFTQDRDSELDELFSAMHKAVNEEDYQKQRKTLENYIENEEVWHNETLTGAAERGIERMVKKVGAGIKKMKKKMDDGKDEEGKKEEEEKGESSEKRRKNEGGGRGRKKEEGKMKKEEEDEEELEKEEDGGGEGREQ